MYQILLTVHHEPEPRGFDKILSKDLNPLIMQTEEIEVEHNAAESRFEAALNDKLALLNYRLNGPKIVFTHTEVPAGFEGRGIGGKLARAGLDYARHSNLSVVPKCPFIEEYIQKHPEYQDLVTSHA